MYDLEKDLHFRPQRVRCQVTLYNDMGTHDASSAMVWQHRQRYS